MKNEGSKPHQYVNKMLVYIENAHNISAYKPIFHYDGNDIYELISEVRNFLGVCVDSKIKFVLYNRRFGSIMRTELFNLENYVGTDVYIRLKLVE